MCIMLVCAFMHMQDQVLRNYLNNEEVRVDDEQQRHEVDEDGVHEDVAAAEPVLAEVVGAARGHVAFGDVPAW